MGCAQSSTAAAELAEQQNYMHQKHHLEENLVVEKKRNVLKDYNIVKQVGEGLLSNIYVVSKKNGSHHSGRYTSSDDEDADEDGRQEAPADPEEVEMVEESEETFALKVIDVDLVEPENIEEMKNEIRLLKSIVHPNIIKAYEFYQSEDDKIALIMEYCSGGNLASRIPYTEQQIQRIVAEILEAVHYLHKKGIMHRDLTMEHILFEDGSENAQIKIVDFGLAKKYVKGSHCKDSVGSAQTMCPQVLRGDYDDQCDMWSVGVIAFQLLAEGEHPFHAEDMNEMTNKAIRGKYSFDGHVWKGVSDDAKDFVSHLLQVDPKHRYTAQQALDHPWIRSQPENMKRREILDSEAVFNMMKDFNSLPPSSEMRKLALVTVAHKLTSQETAPLRELFHALDANHDGVITLSELQSGLGEHFSSTDIEKWFQYADTSGGGEIDYARFLAAALDSYGEIQMEIVEEAFQMFDREERGYITPKALGSVLGVEHDSDYVRQLMTQADADRDGKVSFDEFVAALTRCPATDETEEEDENMDSSNYDDCQPLPQ